MKLIDCKKPSVAPTSPTAFRGKESRIYRAAAAFPECVGHLVHFAEAAAWGKKKWGVEEGAPHLREGEGRGAAARRRGRQPQPKKQRPRRGRRSRGGMRGAGGGGELIFRFVYEAGRRCKKPMRRLWISFNGGRGNRALLPSKTGRDTARSLRPPSAAQRLTGLSALTPPGFSPACMERP